MRFCSVFAVIYDYTCNPCTDEILDWDRMIFRVNESDRLDLYYIFFERGLLKPALFLFHVHFVLKLAVVTAINLFKLLLLFASIFLSLWFSFYFFLLIKSCGSRCLFITGLALFLPAQEKFFLASVSCIRSCRFIRWGFTLGLCD